MKYKLTQVEVWNSVNDMNIVQYILVKFVEKHWLSETSETTGTELPGVDSIWLATVSHTSSWLN